METSLSGFCKAWVSIERCFRTDYHFNMFVAIFIFNNVNMYLFFGSWLKLAFLLYAIVRNYNLFHYLTLFFRFAIILCQL